MALLLEGQGVQFSVMLITAFVPERGSPTVLHYRGTGVKFGVSGMGVRGDERRQNKTGLQPERPAPRAAPCPTQASPASGCVRPLHRQRTPMAPREPRPVSSGRRRPVKAGVCAVVKLLEAQIRERGALENPQRQQEPESQPRWPT